MLKSYICRRFVLCLVLVLVLSFTFIAPAGASPLFSSTWLTVPAQVWVLVWNVVTQAQMESSEEVPPPTSFTESGSSISPIGSSKD